MRSLRKLLGATARKTLGSLTHVITQKAVVALTFDDGPDPDITPRLLRILDRHEARCTFFMVGEAAQEHPSLVRRVAEGRHAIGSHSWDHSSFPSLTSWQRRRQLRACERALAPYGQPLFRPPYGELNVAARCDALWLGYEVVGWNVNSGDWYERNANLLEERLAQNLCPGNVILLHDTLFDRGKPRLGPKPDREPWVNREAMLEAVEVLLKEASAQFRFVTIPELLRSGTPYREFWFNHRSL
jgi:peptidoglycan/xylan/chitin deacetylase (PgdA/CDA1 family)